MRPETFCVWPKLSDWGGNFWIGSGNFLIGSKNFPISETFGLSVIFRKKRYPENSRINHQKLPGWEKFLIRGYSIILLNSGYEFYNYYKYLFIIFVNFIAKFQKYYKYLFTIFVNFTAKFQKCYIYIYLLSL